jgi:CubicO group peptidase (beta-lactamase class C family)
VLNPATGALMGQDNEATAWAKVQALPMEFPTGEQFSYNQTNYVLLGKIIYKLTGKPFAQVFSENQFGVAGMKNTAFGDSRDVIPNMAQQYRYVTNLDGQPLSEARLTHFYYEFPPARRTASGLNSTAEDLAHWLSALQQNKLLKTKPALNTLWTPGTYNNGSPTQWALGWVTKPRPKHRAITATGGGRSAFFVYPDDALAVVVLTNLAGSYPEEFMDELAGCFIPDISLSDPITALHIQLRQRGFDQAIAVLNDAKKKDASYQPPLETDLNDWAYRLMSRGQLKQALELFKLNLHLYPASWNVYDSYGEALFRNGQKAEALAMYQKSVAMNPHNKGGKAMVERLSK